jgi:tRNA(Ile)-lysidine synthase
MNSDPRFARVRVRKALSALTSAGISAVRVAEAAQHLARARAALDAITEAFLADHARLAADFAVINVGPLKTAHREIALRALSTALMRVSGASYRPRFHRLESLFEAIMAGDFRARTLCGCRVGPAPKAKAAFGPATLLISREGVRKSDGTVKQKPERTIGRSALMEAKLADASVAGNLGNSVQFAEKRQSTTLDEAASGSA